MLCARRCPACPRPRLRLCRPQLTLLLVHLGPQLLLLCRLVLGLGPVLRCSIYPLCRQWTLLPLLLLNDLRDIVLI